MKLSSSFLTSTLALAAVALSLSAFAPSSGAAASLPSNGLSGSASGDLILGFRTSASSGNSVLVDLGSVYDLIAAAQAAGGTVYLGNLNDALIDAYGSTWVNQVIYWTVLGQTTPDSNGHVTAWAGQAQLANGAHQLAKNSFVNQAVSSGYGYVITDYNPTATLPANNPYTTSSDIWYTDTGLAAVVTGTPWLTTALGKGANNISGASTPYTSLLFQEAKISTGYGLDLFEIDPATGANTPASLLGSFTFDAEGDFYFTVSASAVPEPATYAALFGGLSLIVAVWVRRRRARG